MTIVSTYKDSKDVNKTTIRICTKSIELIIHVILRIVRCKYTFLHDLLMENTFQLKMKVPKKTASKFLKGAFVITLLVHICSSCSSKAQGFKFQDDEVSKVLPEANVQADTISSELKIQDSLSDKHFEENINGPDHTVNRRDGKEIESIEHKATIESGAPRFARKVISEINVAKKDKGMLCCHVQYIRVITYNEFLETVVLIYSTYILLIICS